MRKPYSLTLIRASQNQVHVSCLLLLVRKCTRSPRTLFYSRLADRLYRDAGLMYSNGATREDGYVESPADSPQTMRKDMQTCQRP